jgi:hypothetical protein
MYRAGGWGADAFLRLSRRTRGWQTILTIEGLANAFTKDETSPLAGSLCPAWRGAVRILHPRADHDLLCAAQAQPRTRQRRVRFALKDTLCRCAGYPTIENAILAAAHSLRTGEPVHPPHIPNSVNAIKFDRAQSQIARMRWRR